jgi:hypothetical protein
VTSSGFLYALNSDSTLKWTYEVGENVVTSPVIGTDGYIYFGDDRGRIHAVNASTGTAKSGWPISIELGLALSTPAFAADNYFYVNTDEQRVFCVNSVDGKIRWETPYLPLEEAKSRKLRGKREDLIPSPVIGDDGDIYVAAGEDDPGLYRIKGRSAGTRASTAWPMFRHDQNHSGKAGFTPGR